VDTPAHNFIARTCWETFGVRVDAEGIDRIGRFLDLLMLWNRRLRLTGERELEGLIRKHVIDSLACVPLMPLHGRILDLGTGAGFPGAVLSCVRPDADVTLLDARERPVTFLREVIRRLQLSHTLAVTMRAEDAVTDPMLATRHLLVTCRAVRIDVFLPLARRLLASGGLAVSMQTPRLARNTVQTMAREHGLGLVELRDYRLPDGEPRRLVVVR
jgi:16S rRNA (guanine527-N7)-methyltransferase